MINLPAIHESCLSVTLGGVTASDVVLIGPDGERYPARGSVTNEFTRVGTDSRGIAHGGRNSMVVYKSCVVLRRSSLAVIPDDEENWTVIVPEKPGGTPDTLLFLEEATDGTKTIGMITLRLVKTKQVA